MPPHRLERVLELLQVLWKSRSRLLIKAVLLGLGQAHTQILEHVAKFLRCLNNVTLCNRGIVSHGRLALPLKFIRDGQVD